MEVDRLDYDQVVPLYLDCSSHKLKEKTTHTHKQNEVVVYHLHGQTGRFTVWVNGNQAPPGGTPYDGLYGEAPPERAIFFRLQV